MKNTKKVFMFILSFFIILNAYWYDIENIEVTNDKTVNFSLGKDVQLADKYSNSDVKVLEDLEVLSSSKSFEDQTKLTLSLGRELKANYSYSILTLFWAEWNMDFKLWNDIKWIKLENTLDTWIKSILIKNSKTIELTFVKPIVWDEFDFKILREIPIDKVVKNEKWGLTVTILEKFIEKTNYMVVAISLKDKLWTLLSFEEGIYDFKSPDILVKLDPTNTSTWSTNKEQWVQTWSLNAWSWALQSLSNSWSENSELERIALNAAKTPDTWADSSILILLTLVSSAIVSFRKKFSKS